MRTILCVICLLGSSALAQTNDLVTAVRSSVATVAAALPEGVWGEASQIREFGTNPRGFPGYQNLVNIVSNNQDFICSNINVCATNEISRMMLLSAWWGGDDALYISGLSRCLDLAMSGVVSREDLTWYRFGHGLEERCNVLALRYNAPGISNLIVRLCNFTGETNACQRILSGEARRSYLEYVDDISHIKDRK